MITIDNISSSDNQRFISRSRSVGQQYATVHATLQLVSQRMTTIPSLITYIMATVGLKPTSVQSTCALYEAKRVLVQQSRAPQRKLPGMKSHRRYSTGGLEAPGGMMCRSANWGKSTSGYVICMAFESSLFLYALEDKKARMSCARRQGDGSQHQLDSSTEEIIEIGKWATPSNWAPRFSWCHVSPGLGNKGRLQFMLRFGI